MADKIMDQTDSPSPESKLGTNKRVLLSQGNPVPPIQPDPNQPLTLEASGQDGNLGNLTTNPNPNSNPNANLVILGSASRQLSKQLFQLKKTQTQHTKVSHHITFLSTALDETAVPNGLAWNITVNVVEPNDSINKAINDHIKQLQFALIELIREHYHTVETKLANKVTQLTNDIEKL